MSPLAPTAPLPLKRLGHRALSITSPWPPNPTNPAQICSVANGSGTVPTVDVTNVAVSCAEPVVGDLIKIAAEGETLGDGALLTTILIDGGVSINLFGMVAFGGRDGDNNVAVFTQDELEAKEGGTVADGTLVEDISRYGEVAISAGWSGDRVAFHGQTDNTNAVFTDAGLEAKVGDTLPDGTIVHRIDSEGKVAINNLNQVAFHGKIQLGSGVFNREEFRAVFTSRGLAAQEETELEDGTLLQKDQRSRWCGDGLFRHLWPSMEQPPVISSIPTRCLPRKG